MSGFTLYETLRILVPGVLGTVILNIVLRLALGQDPLAYDHLSSENFDLNSALSFTAISLVLGLLLYQIDLPAKMRIQREGDPNRELHLPSATLKDLLGESDLARNAMGLYFILSDYYLPLEMHKRVYLFGSLYRVFVDLRILLALGAVTSSPVSAIVGRIERDSGGVDVATVAVGVGLIGVLIAIGLYGIRRHEVAYNNKRKREGSPERYGRSQRGKDFRGSSSLAVAISLSSVLGILFILQRNWFAIAIGVILYAASLALWLAAEIGPPEEDGEESTLRSAILLRLGGRRSGDVQYAPIQRLVFDLSLFVPTISLAVVANRFWDRSPMELLFYLVLIAPCVALMSFRKHEERLLFIYEEQSLWLRLHRDDIEHIKRTGVLPERWR